MRLILYRLLPEIIVVSSPVLPFVGLHAPVKMTERQRASNVTGDTFPLLSVRR